MPQKDTLQIILLILLAIAAIYRWVRFFKAQKKGVEHKFSRWESITVMVLIMAYLYVSFFMYEG